MECRAHDLYDFFNVTRRTVDVRKAGKMVMKSKIVFNMTYKTHIKNVRIFDHEKKNGLKKMLNLCLIILLSICYTESLCFLSCRHCYFYIFLNLKLPEQSRSRLTA